MEHNSQSHYGKVPVGVTALINIIGLVASHICSGSAFLWNALRNARKNIRHYLVELAHKRQEAALQNFVRASEQHKEFTLFACTHKGFIAGANNIQDLKQKVLAARCSLKNKNLLVVERSQRSGSATLFKSDGSIWLYFPELGEPEAAPGARWAWPSN